MRGIPMVQPLRESKSGTGIAGRNSREGAHAAAEADDLEYASTWGDGGAWISQGHLTREQFAGRVDALACEAVAGRKPGRLSRDQRIVAIIQGMAIGDIAFAAHALNEAERLGRGSLVDLP